MNKICSVILLIVLSGSGCASLYSPVKVTEKMVLHGHQDKVLSVAFNPSGSTLVSAGEDRSLILWDVATGRILKEVYAHADTVFSVSFSADGKRILSSGGDRLVKVWDAASLELLAVLQGFKKSVYTAGFSPDDTIIAAGGADYSIRTWDAAGYESINILTGHGNSVQHLLFAHEGPELYSGSSDMKIKRWDLETGFEIENYKRFKAEILVFAFSAGETLLVGTSSGAILLMDIESGQILKRNSEAHSTLSTDSVIPQKIWGLSVKSDNSLFITCGEDQRIKFWELPSLRRLKVISLKSKVWCLDLAKSETLLAAGTNRGEIFLYDLESAP